MKTKRVSEIMVPLSKYETVGEDMTMHDAAMALKKRGREIQDPLLVVEEDGNVVGRISQLDLLLGAGEKVSRPGRIRPHLPVGIQQGLPEIHAGYVPPLEQASGRSLRDLGGQEGQILYVFTHRKRIRGRGRFPG